MKKIPLILLLCFFGINSYSQDKTLIDPAKNVVHGSIGSLGLLNTAQFTYDRRVKHNNEAFFTAYYLTIKGGRQIGVDFSGTDSGTGYVTSIGATALTGKGRHHFEIGLGLGYFTDTENIISESNSFGTSDESTFYPNVSLGYRKQTIKGFMFRAGFGIVEWAYVGIGFSF